MSYARLIGEGDFNSNTRILGAKASAIEEYFKESEAKLCTLDHDISLLRSKIDDLVSHKREVAEMLTAYKAHIAPIRRVMPEVLQEIFFHCIPTSHNAIMSSKEAPLLLGRVCSYWRNVAFSTPALWSSLHICIPSSPPKTHTGVQITTVIYQWLCRSRALPLSISISSCQEILSKSLHRLSMQEVINVIALFAPRWKRIYLKDSYYKWDDLFLQVKVEDVPLLEELVLVGYGGPDALKKAVALVKEKKSMLSAPLLHRISFRPLGPNIKHYPIHWRILTSLDLKGVMTPYNDIINTLNQCPSLEICTLSIESSGDILDEEETTVYTDDKIFLPRLCTLSLVPEYIIHTGNTIHFFRSLYAPQLRHLTIERVSDVFRRDIDMDNYPQDSFLLPTLFTFFATLEHGLEELCLRSLFLPSRNIVVALLKHLPLLRRLSLRLSLDGMVPPQRNDIQLEAQWCFDDSILDMFVLKRNDDWGSDKEPVSTSGESRATSSLCLCPHLEVLHCTGANFKPSSLLYFLRSRTLPIYLASSNVSRMREVSISFMQGVEPPSEEVRKEIEMLEVNTGLNLDLWYYISKQTSRSQYDIATWAFRLERNFSVYDGLSIEDEWSINSGGWSRFPLLQEQKRDDVGWV